MKTKGIFWFFWLAAVYLDSTTASSQEYCQDVLRLAGHNYSFEMRQNSIANDIYEKNCDGTNINESNTAGINIGIISESIPIKFGIKGASGREKLSLFCKDFHKYHNLHRFEFTETELVSSEAIKAWGQCLKLFSEGVTFIPQIQRTQLTIDVQKRSANPVYVRGVFYDKNVLSCRASIPNDPGAQTINMDENSKLILNDGNFWQIACSRKVSEGVDGAKLYDQSDLSILTSAGSYVLTLPADAALPIRYSRELSSRIDKLQSDLRENNQMVQAEVSQLGNRVPKLECRNRSDLSKIDKFPSVISRMVAQEKMDGFEVTGGGCEQVLDKNEYVNAIGTPLGDMISRPDGRDGWFCKMTRSAPFGSEDLRSPIQVKSYLVYCRISPH